MDIPPFNGFAAQHYLWFDPQHNGGTAPQTYDFQFVGYTSFPYYDYEKNWTCSGWFQKNIPEWIIAKTVFGIHELKIEFAFPWLILVSKKRRFMISCSEIPNPY